jgi:hypothetical protein
MVDDAQRKGVVRTDDRQIDALSQGLIPERIQRVGRNRQIGDGITGTETDP